MGKLADTTPTDPTTATDPATDPQDPPVDEPSRVDQMADELREMTADPATPPSADPGTAGQAGGDDSDGNSESSPPATEPTGSTDYIQIGDLRIPADQADAVAGLINWASSLTEEQAAAAFAVTQPTQPTQPAAAPESTPEPPAQPGLTLPEDFEATYPELAAAMKAQQEQIEQLRNELAPRVEQVEQVTGQQALAAAQQEIAETEARVRESFLQAKGLTDDDYVTLTKSVADMGIVNALVDSLGLEAGFAQALEVAYNANPEFVQRQVQAQLRQAQTDARKSKAAALSPQGGSAPRQTPTGANLPVSERKRAMIDDINQIIGG